MKKIISILVFIASVVLLTGCKLLTTTTQNIDLSVDINKNKPELRVIYPNSGIPNSEFSQSYTTKMYEEVTGYKVTYEQILESDISKVITNILVNRQEYHLMKLDPGTYGTEYKNKSFAELSDLIDVYGQDLKRVIPEEAWAAVTNENGEIYGIPEVGFSGMMGFALVWNKNHLQSVGIHKIPETIGEVNTAFEKLQAKFGSEVGSNYHAFAMQGSQAYIEPFGMAFGLPKDFYVTEDNKISHVMFHDQYLPYMNWLNALQNKKIISQAWQSLTGAEIMTQFAREEISCGYIPYWNMNSLYNMMAATPKYESKEAAKENIEWSLYIRGDGTNGSLVQEEAKFYAGLGIGYYCCIPIHMASYAPHVINWMNERIKEENYLKFYCGTEGEHYEFTTEDDPEGVEVTIGGEKKYAKSIGKYSTDVLVNSMYASGGNPTVAVGCWALREKTYNSWDILVDINDPNCVRPAMEYTPYISGWSEIDIQSRSWVITMEQGYINETDPEMLQRRIDKLRANWKSKYWKENVDANVQAWYQSTLK